jgi:zinc protease
MFTLSLSGVHSPPIKGQLQVADYLPKLADFTLTNGLRVILAQDHSAPVVAVNLWYHVGGANDPEHRSGFAHLFEHLMFEGSAHVAKGEYDAYLDAVGAEHNAYTEADYTSYLQVVPAHQLPLVLWLESDRMASLDLNQATLDRERQVVIQELNQRIFNAPYGRSDYQLETTAFQGYPPYERSTAGSIADLKQATLADVKAFHRKYYIPNNATLAIVGDLDLDQTRALVQAYFGEIPPGEPVEPILDRYPLPQQFPVSRSEASTGCLIGHEQQLIDPLIELPRVDYTVVAPPRGTADFYALSLLAQILSEGESSRFMRDLIRPGLMTEAEASLETRTGASVFTLMGIPNPGDPVKQAQSLLQSQLATVRAQGVTAQELAWAKQQLTLSTIRQLRQSVLQTAELLLETTRQWGHPQAVIKEIAQFEAVTPLDIQRVAQRYLCDQPMNRLMTLKTGKAIVPPHPGPLVAPVERALTTPALLPAPSELSASVTQLPPGVVRRDGPPDPLPLRPTRLPTYHTFQLRNGLQAIVVEQTDLPIVTATLWIGGSDVATPIESRGLADLLAHMLTQGTLTASASDLADRVESIGGALEAKAHLEYFSLEMDAPAPEITTLFEVLAEVTRQPTFPDSAFQVAQDQALTTLQTEASEPESLAQRQFFQLAYPNHPYGVQATATTLAQVTRDQIVAFHDRWFKPNNALLVIVGDITTQQAQAEVNRVFGDWQPGSIPTLFDYPPIQPPNPGTLHLIHRPNSEQATVYVGNPSVTARDPARYPFTVVNALLGVGFTGRLNQNLRVDKGYTYGVYSSVNTNTHAAGAFMISTDVDPQYTGAAVREILKELHSLRTQPISDAELERVKGLLLGQFDLSLESPATTANRLASYQRAGIPLEEAQVYRDKIRQVTPAEILAAASTYIAAQPIVVVVGDATLIEPQLDQLGYQIDGEPLRKS